jgi:hypothetical protein
MEELTAILMSRDYLVREKAMKYVSDAQALVQTYIEKREFKKAKEACEGLSLEPDYVLERFGYVL